MGDALDDANRLILTLDQVLLAVPMASGPKQRLTDARASAAAILAELQALSEWVPLRVDDRGTALSNSRREWEALPGGPIAIRDASLQRLRDGSDTLSTLFRSGVDILSLTRFHDGELELARELGDSFNEWHRAWDLVKIGTSNGGSEVNMLAHEFPAVERWLGALRGQGVLHGFETWIHIVKERTWKPISANKIRHLNPNQPVGVRVLDVNRAMLPFISGDWLTAYAYQAVADHLERNHFDFEIYSKVCYSAPPEIIRVKGDFDLLVRAGEYLALVECKSGRLRQRDEYADIVGKAAGLAEVFRRTRADLDPQKCRFLLVYNPFLNPPKEVEAALAGTNVTPTTLADLRGLVMDIFRPR